ncbi:MAG: DUF4405 domain-containing protein [Rhodospirillaceae bacterium]|nr:DUF4405 domain-containing protein [Rhodospirillaceae bacterium]
MSDNTNPRKKTSYRAMTSLVTTWAFVIATMTGVVLYITPKGRVANWMIWDLWSLTKEAWGELHITFSIVFVVVGVAHLVYNWKPFKSYMSERARGHIHVKRTVYGSLAIVAVFFVLSVYKLPPASWVFDLEATIKDSWVTAPEFEPPFGHAEDVSLVGFAKRQFIDPAQALKALADAGIQVPEKRMKLKDIAALNLTTPMHLYAVIKPLERRPELKSSLTPDDVEAQFAGQGIGRKTLTQLADELGLEMAIINARLKAIGIEAKPDAKMKAIGEAKGIEPIDLLKVILVEGFRP